MNIALDHVKYKDKDKLLQKLDNFSKKGINNIHFVMDFDRTLTVSKDQKVDVTTFNIIRSHLSQELKDKSEALYQKYRPLELNHVMTTQEAVEWWEGTLSLFVDDKLNWVEIKRDFKNKASIRPGTKELFQLLNEHAIPNVVLSAGVKDAILLWCQEYAIEPPIILSTKLTISDEEIITGWDKNTLIHIFNKNEMGHSELSTIKAVRPYTILVGDALEDASMVDGEEDVLRIKIHDLRPDEKKNADEILKISLEKFDIILEDGSLNFVNDLVHFFQA